MIWLLSLALQVDPALQDYKAGVEKLTGTLHSVGTDSLGGLVARWGEGFSGKHPDVKLAVEAKGSSTAPPALTSRVAQLAPMVRPMNAAEQADFLRSRGYPPTEIRIGLEGVCIVVEAQNPLQGLSPDAVQAIFSNVALPGLPQGVQTWGDLGLGGAWAQQAPLSLYGRNSASGLHGFMRTRVLQGAAFKNAVKEQPGSASVVLGVSTDRLAIGYCSLGALGPGVKALAIGDPIPVPPTPVTVRDGTYPLARSLVIYVDKDPRGGLNPLVREFLRYALSKQGQGEVDKEGFVSLSARLAAEERKKLE